MSDSIYVKAYAYMKAEVWFNDDTTVTELIAILSRIDPRAKVSTVYRASPAAGALAGPNYKPYNIDFVLPLGEEEEGSRQ